VLNMRAGMVSVTSWTRRPCSRSYDEARQLATGAGSDVSARGVRGDAAPIDALLPVGELGLGREATDAPGEALASCERPPRSPGLGAGASSRISPSRFSAVIRHTRRGVLTAFAFTTNHSPESTPKTQRPHRKKYALKTWTNEN